MLLIAIRVLYLVVCAGAIAACLNLRSGEPDPSLPSIVSEYKGVFFFIFLGVTQLVTVFDVIVRRKRIEVISAIYFGLLVGILLSYLLTQALTPLVPPESPFHSTVVVLALTILPYICISLLLQTKDDFRFVIPYVEFVRDLKSGRPLIVDSSSLIDGRISDVVETQILESQLIVPDFVLAEIQDIADSHDRNRRTRGRRGLEVLAKLQKSKHADVRMYDTTKTEKGVSVDQRLVMLAKEVRGGVITNDFNLNKVASVQGIAVINLNDVATALKPRFIPGERLRIKVIKEGEGEGQGVGYLDDGTMVVCEQASNSVGKEMNVIVTSVLQSSAGRMIFGKPVHTASESAR